MKTKLCVGDKVKVIKSINFRTASYIGLSGTLISIRKRSKDWIQYEVTFDDDDWELFDESELQLITPKKSQWKPEPYPITKSTPKKKSKEIKQEDKKECKCENCAGKGILPSSVDDNHNKICSICNGTGEYKDSVGFTYECKCQKPANSPSLLNDIETIEEIPLDDGDCRVRDIVNLLIKNDRIHTQILNLLIKKNNGKRIK